MSKKEIKKTILRQSALKAGHRGSINNMNKDFGEYETRTVYCLADFGIDVFVGSRNMRRIMILKKEEDGLPILLDFSK